MCSHYLGDFPSAFFAGLDVLLAIVAILYGAIENIPYVIDDQNKTFYIANCFILMPKALCIGYNGV